MTKLKQVVLPTLAFILGIIITLCIGRVSQTEATIREITEIKKLVRNQTTDSKSIEKCATKNNSTENIIFQNKLQDYENKFNGYREENAELKKNITAERKHQKWLVEKVSKENWKNYDQIREKIGSLTEERFREEFIKAVDEHYNCLLRVRDLEKNNETREILKLKKKSQERQKITIRPDLVTENLVTENLVTENIEPSVLQDKSDEKTTSIGVGSPMTTSLSVTATESIYEADNLTHFESDLETEINYTESVIEQKQKPGSLNITISLTQNESSDEKVVTPKTDLSTTSRPKLNPSTTIAKNESTVAVHDIENTESTSKSDDSMDQ